MAQIVTKTGEELKEMYNGGYSLFKRPGKSLFWTDSPTDEDDFVASPLEFDSKGKKFNPQNSNDNEIYQLRI